jgi:hypothetical protein
MNEVQVKKSNICDLVNSIHILNRKNPHNHSLVRVSDYEPRCEATRKKIRVLISAMDEWTKNTNGSRLAIPIGTKLVQAESILNELHNAIGTYDIIEPPFGFISGRRHVCGNEWLDYLGDQSIRKGGGHIVVMLSDEGVKQLNDIAHKLYPFVQSSVTT